jgi:hypothetical protein
VLPKENNGVRLYGIFLSGKAERFLFSLKKSFFWSFAQFFLQFPCEYDIIKMFFSDNVGMCSFLAVEK